MKIKQGYTIRTIASEIIVVPTGEEAIRFNGIITLNKTSKFLFEALSQSQSKESLVKLLLNQYDVTEDLAKKDVEDFLGILDKQGMLVHE